MDTRELMTLIDQNADNISDGDYLKMCNTLKSYHAKEIIFNSSRIPTPPITTKPSENPRKRYELMTEGRQKLLQVKEINKTLKRQYANGIITLEKLTQIKDMLMS